MIQRIQSIWLFLAGAIIFALFLFPYLQYIDIAGLGKVLKVTGAYTSIGGEPRREDFFVLQTIVTVLVGLLPIFTIFKFKNRKTQIQLIYLNFVVILLLGLWLYVTASKTLASVQQFLGASNIGVGFFLLPISLIFLSMALSAIRRDDKLIRSADRLR